MDAIQFDDHCLGLRMVLDLLIVLNYFLMPKKSRNTKSVCMYLVVALWITLVFCNEVTMPIEGKMCVPTVYMGRKLCLVALDQQKKKNMS